jgi:ketosteroid isomerase-like protein
MSSPKSFEQAIEASHRALDEITRGNPEPFFERYSRSDDATLANPYGPQAHGFNEIEAGGRRAAANYRDGKAVGFKTFAKFATGDLGYMLEIERLETRVAGADEISQVALRVTSVFRCENSGWKLLHRHADPITARRSDESVLQS